MTVELRATQEIDGQVVWCNESEATAFSVYLGEPGDFEWIADFKNYWDGYCWAEEVADCNETNFVDYVSLEKEKRA